ncbi:MAG TPA: AbrB/MazE/SpoVT family DNA-binding domain-containing protein [Candidatus Hydrogenedentes bacterium]|nr:AbrB/MazE/SpoVT family DNA-binding domain-containing protein [Candidatus Hydrogenedentota bacterium]
MVTKVQKWGNSQGLRLSRELLQAARITVGDEVVVTANEGEIRITPASRVRGRYRLKELLDRVPPRGKTPEEDWGRPEGGEVW